MRIWTTIAAASLAATPALAQDAAPVSNPAPAPASNAEPAPAPDATVAPGVSAPASTVDAATSSPAPVAAAQPAAPQCELHVWPAERFQAITTGWLTGFGMIGAIADASAHAEGDKARRANLASALDPEGQLEALKGLDLVTLLRLQPSQIIVHAEPLDAKTAGKTATRHAQSSSPCYAELVVTGVLYQKAAIYGRSLKTSFLFRNFGSAVQQPVKYSTTGGNGLKLFPPKEGEDVTAANQELVSIFQKNFVEAAQNFARQAGH